MSVAGPIAVTQTPEGFRFKNESSVEQYVVVRDGDRMTKMLLSPNESRALNVSPSFEMTHSTDTSPARGKINLIGGCGPGCEHD